jgi:hypothetical protein
MSSERKKEEIMKKLALIGIAVLGLSLTVVAQAPAKPSGIPKTEVAQGMTPAEYRALMLRSEGLNRLYGIDVPVKGENFYSRGFSAAPDDSVPVKGENYFANGLPNSTPTVASTGSNDFEWGNVGIGAVALLGLLAIVAGVIGLRRHRLHLRTS